MKYSIPVWSFVLVLVVTWTALDRCHALVIPKAVVFNVYRYQSSTRQTLWSTSQDDNTPTQPAKQVVCPDCDLCDGSGRIAGGIGAVIPWIPIKAFRPCPNFINRGGLYERAGQGLDEIAFGRDSTFTK